MITLRSQVLSNVPGVEYGFGRRGEEIPHAFEESWKAHAPVWNQVAGVDLAHIKEARQACGNVDAMWTTEKGLPIGIRAADCVPILLALRDGSAVAAVHSGWRGTKSRIIEQVFARLGDPSKWVAVVGPAIGACCYEVSEEISQEFAREFNWMGANQAVPKHRHLDLHAINAAMLKRLGIGELEVMPYCTHCSRDAEGGNGFAFESYRRDRLKARQFSVIMKR